MSQTISQILERYDGFEKAFWASYSINFTTLDFLLKKDFKDIMSPHYLHFVCDGHQLDKSLAVSDIERNDMAKLSRLQEYCTISPQFAPGSFHPKIILFTSKTKLLFIVSSANATPSGILSNQDLIGSFYYDEDNAENLNEICSLYQYLRSYDGWGAEAREDLKVVEEDFEFLNEDLSANTILTIPNKENLFSQIAAGLPDEKPKIINIFSPFFDDNYTAISHINEYFKVPINIFSPQKTYQTSRKDRLSDNVKFYHSDTQINKSFHAKFYEFNYGDQSIVYWGSANCSYSGLLSPNRNYEFLIKCHMSKEDIRCLWGSLSDKNESSVEYGRQVDQENENKEPHSVHIKEVSIIEDGLSVRLDKPLLEKADLRGIINNGAVVDLTIQSTDGDTVHTVFEGKGLVILYFEKDQKRISNLIYVNNPFALQARVSGNQGCPNSEPQNIKTPKAVTHAFGYFSLKSPAQNNNRPQSQTSRRGFWRLPQFKSRSHLSNLINLETFIKQRLVKLKIKNDPETPSNNNKNDSNQNQSVIDFVAREADKLLRNVIVIVEKNRVDEIEIYRWLQGMDILNCYILDYLENIPTLPKNNTEIVNLLFNISRVSAWIIYNLIDNNKDHCDRIELIRTIQDVLLGLSIYNLLLTQKYTSPLKAREFVDQLLTVKRALHLRHITTEKFSEFKSDSEHSQLTFGDVLEKLPNIIVRKKSIEILERRKIKELNGLDDVLIFSNKTLSLLFIKKSGKKIEFETMLGEEKKFSHTDKLKSTNILQME